ncbi:MAG: SDR family oxidoreductase [Chloroflexi bacterium]|nr:SDR family oxidoreductase [Chloroflexota bacterium]
MAKKDLLADQVVLITGAGRGIGRAAALEFAAAGARVVVTSRTEQEVSETAKMVKAQGAAVLAMPADVSSERSVTALVAKATRRFGGIDILVNNAGLLAPIGPLWTTKPAAWRKNVRTNLEGVYLCSHAVLPGMLRRKHGAIINVSTGAARSARYGWSAYCASKAAVDQLTRVMAVELRDQNIRVNAIYPGTTETRMQALIRDTEDEAMGGEVQVFRDRHAHGLNLPPHAPARLIVWLARQTDLHGQILDIYDPAVKEKAGL